MGTPLSVLNWIKNSISYPAEGDILKKYKAPSETSVDKSVMAEMPSKSFSPQEKVRPFSEEFADTVKETVQKYSQPKEVVKFLSEMAIDPTNYIPAAKGLAGAGILSLLMKKGTISPSRAAIGMDIERQIGAFRPEGSKISPASTEHIATDRMSIEQLLDARKNGLLTRQEGFETLMASKLSDKELAKYGAPSFKLDPHLSSTASEDFTKLRLQPTEDLEVARKDLTRLVGQVERSRRQSIISRENQRSVADARKRAGLFGWTDDDIAETLGVVDSLAKQAKAGIAQVKVISEAEKFNVPLWSAKSVGVKTDIMQAIEPMATELRLSGISIEDLSRKSLVQLMATSERVKAERIAREEAAARAEAFIPEFTKKRTATLKEEQGLPYGFVELKTPADMGAETHYLNHCAGAGGMDPATGKYKPQFHPVTGAEMIKNETSSFKRYYGKIQSGEERLFSYRPEGEPVFTVRINAKTGEVIEAQGLSNRDLTKEEHAKAIAIRDHILPQKPPSWTMVD